jgi:hypothetical protein
MANTTTYDFEELPLLTIDGIDTAHLISGGAEISYRPDGEWGIEAIWLDGWRSTTADEREKNPTLGFEVRAYVTLPTGHPVRAMIECRLLGSWREHVQDHVNEAIDIDRENYQSDARHDARDAIFAE